MSIGYVTPSTRAQRRAMARMWRDVYSSSPEERTKKLHDAYMIQNLFFRHEADREKYLSSIVCLSQLLSELSHHELGAMTRKEVNQQQRDTAMKEIERRRAVRKGAMNWSLEGWEDVNDGE